MSHTPTPWRAYNATNGRILKHWRIQRDDAKQDIALISLDVPADAREQTAAHIVRCVNSHEAMLDMLKTALAYIETPGDLNDGERACLIEDLNDTIKAAEA